jgi:hypothetical protein
MKLRFPRRHTSGAVALGRGTALVRQRAENSSASGQDRACCCPAWPVVQVTMPPTAQRPHPVDLLLCGHHYRMSRDALAAAGATAHSLPGRADIAAAALFTLTGRPRAAAR